MNGMKVRMNKRVIMKKYLTKRQLIDLTISNYVCTCENNVKYVWLDNWIKKYKEIKIQNNTTVIAAIFRKFDKENTNVVNECQQ